MTQFLRQKITDFIKNKKGVVIPIFAVSALTVITVTAVAININQYNSLETELQALADKATNNALARERINGMASNATDCQDTFIDGIAKNPTLKSAVTLLTRPSKLCARDVSTGSAIWGLKARVTLKTLFSNHISAPIKKTIISKASYNDIKHEIIIVTSLTGTMCAEAIDSVMQSDSSYKGASNAECKKITLLKQAIRELYEELNYFADVNIGFVPYTYKVRFPDITKIPPSIQKSALIENDRLVSQPEDPNFYKTFKDQENLPPIQPLKAASVLENHNFLKSFLDSIDISPEVPAWSRPDLGMHVAGLMLDKTMNKYFNHSASEWNPVENIRLSDGSLAPKKAKVRKIIILLTDGMNLGGVYTNHPSKNFNNQYTYDYHPYNKHLSDVCSVLKAPEKNVQIYTVLLNPPTGIAQAAYLENNLSRCSSNFSINKKVNDLNNDGLLDNKYISPTNVSDQVTCDGYFNFCYKASDVAELDEIFGKIGRKINTVVTRE